ncbi:cobalamin biosynthesis protein [Sansalvadorimonas sp. 2012CJ34-2]|uniref:Cobalamin biosynthesis protein n=1 Tax=Parendozoicomonas callyspongiae TaxID=2942213 RepID=A0ABT0PFC7_9GAMM|nr:cobalamin biosynthesis protein [Sansalvadorimonas sp. 2012CJ34-2]MCL6270077.1 cobalamin biosynthesis protein [Sansalvadorimonas sp. 2012CJ34-2]
MIGNFVVGVHSIRGTPLEVIGQGVMQRLDQLDIDIRDVTKVASIHLKKFDPAYDEFARVHDVPFVTCDAEALWSVSAPAQGCMGLGWFSPAAVSERAALFFSEARQLLAPTFLFQLCYGQHYVVVSICRDSVSL